MATLGEYAKEHVSATATKNIVELPEVMVDVELHDDSFEFIDKVTGETKTVKQKVIKIGEEKFRCPTSVTDQLKVHLLDNPNLKKFKVRSTGTGMDTRYTVIPLMD